jgi:hypothetical protein
MTDTLVFNPFEEKVIKHIIAENEEIPQPDDLDDYIRAIEGGFASDMKFTLYLPARNKLILYVHDVRMNNEWDDRNTFYRRCEQIKKNLLPIADCINFLAQNDFVRVTYKPTKEQERPTQYELEHWRKYEQFTMTELETLINACSIRIVPKFKLYGAAHDLISWPDGVWDMINPMEKPPND